MVENIHSEIREIKNYAKVKSVPIMNDDGINYLTNFIIKQKVKKVLEIGTAIGYSSIMMALCNPLVEITSIERDEIRYLEALKNIKKLKLEDRITLIYNDALDTNITDMYDLIFIDAAKGQNINFFERFENNLNTDGYIITDNMNFHGLVLEDEINIKSKNLRSLIRKIKAYKNYLIEKEGYITEFLNVGDGLAVTKKVK